MRIRTVQNDVALLVSNPQLLSVLEAAGIKTTEDVLFTPLADLLPRLSTADIKTTDIIMLQDEIAAVCAVQGLRGDKLLAQETETISAMKPITEGVLGIKGLDELLGETLYGPYVVELTGPARSGKSTIATQLATRCLSQIQDSSVLWIDCAGDFSGHRARQACEALGMEEDAIGATLERLQVVFCFEMHEFQSALDNIEASLSETTDASLRYIIIDPITPLLSAQLTGSSSQGNHLITYLPFFFLIFPLGHATMTSIMQQLARIAHEHKLTVLVCT
ncbi:hypothetical protein BDV93DRAFT_440962 [Ceratobasidium sp. AG-I]|nr:hypothetical protein BDV93DRAFT_440962 [Ceratobasidium sp. AG-I]